MKYTTFVIFIFTAIYLQFARADEESTIEFLNSTPSSTLPFSEAVRVGDMLFLSGQIGVNAETGKLVTGGIIEESKQTLENIKRTLEVHGYSIGDVVKCTVMLADIKEWAQFNEVYVSYFVKPYPARSAFGANGLALGARVEVECIAASAG